MIREGGIWRIDYERCINASEDHWLPKGTPLIYWGEDFTRNEHGVSLDVSTLGGIIGCLI